MFLAGPYTASYNAQSLGVTEDGWEMEYTFSGDPIVGDNLGDSVQDQVYRGGNCFFSAILSEWNLAAVRLAFWPFHSTFGRIGEVGANVIDATTNFGGAEALVLSLSGAICRHGGVVGPVTITVRHGVLALNTPVRHLFASRHRKVGIRMQALPYVSGASPSYPPHNNSAAVWFTAV